MSLTPSNMIPLGTKAPDFNLINAVDLTDISLSDVRGPKGTLVMFICNHCPIVIHVIEELVHIANEYLNKGVGFVAINSNDIVSYPDDSPGKMQLNAINYKFCFPYLFDETQKTAKAYDAACTPDFFLFDTNLKLVYRGQLDDSRPGNKKPVTGKDLRTALDLLIKNKSQKKIQKPSIGCNIKWK